MIKGLNTGNAALVTAAAGVIHDNAADVAGNNIPVTGGTFNADGLTVADVLSTAGGGGGALPAVAAAAPAAATAPVAAAAAPAADAAPAVAASAPAPLTTVADAGPTAVEIHHSPAEEMALHFHHMWG
jgi:hypothetical protein